MSEEIEQIDGELIYMIRAKIEAFHELHGACWLGKMNLYDWDTDRRVLWEHKAGEVVHNTFGAAFMVPAYDAELEQLIRERSEAEYTGAVADSKRVDAIFARIDALGGTHLSLYWV